MRIAKAGQRLWVCWLLLAAAGPVAGQVVISEFAAADQRLLADENQDYEDWIELFNASSAAVDLGGWHLTDETDNPTKWKFPATVLEPNQFLVVFASDKNRRVSGQPLHTNFKLKAGGDYLALVKPDGVTRTTEFAPTFPPQASGASYGLPFTSRTQPLLALPAPARFLVPPNGALGDAWTTPEFDDSAWTEVTTGVGFDPAGQAAPVPVADSIEDWSPSGAQGFRGWWYGYYNKAKDVVAGYQTNDFIAFPRADTAYGAANYWNGMAYRWPAALAPWDTLGQTDAIPNGSNSGGEHWVIRRWVSTTNAALEVRWRLAKAFSAGTGVTGKLFHNGLQMDTATVAGTNLTGLVRTVALPNVRQGDLLDLVLTPAGTAGGADDRGDTARVSLTIYAPGTLGHWIASPVGQAMQGVNASAYLRVPFAVTNVQDVDQLTLKLRYDDGFVAYLNGVEVARRNAPVATAAGTYADSARDWSTTGQQGAEGWHYGFYNLSADADGAYDPDTDFTDADPQWSWNGSAWVLGAANPPWDFIAATSWHPNGSNSGETHWVIRRWVSQVTGTVTCSLAFAKENPSCGDGVTLRVLHRGLERFSRSIAFNDTTGVRTNLVLSDVQAGDFIDFALDPRGPDGLPNDSCDGSTFTVAIDQGDAEGLSWQSHATAGRSATQASEPERFDLTRYRDFLRAGANLLAIHGLNVSANDGDFLLAPELQATRLAADEGQRAYFTRPTPGTVNGGGALVIGPIISAVAHSPLLPQDQDDLVVTARVTRSLQTISSVRLIYRVMYGPETTVGMADDGAHGDGAPGDGVYGAVIPAAAARAGQMVRYAIVAADTSGYEMRFPDGADPLNSPLYHGTVVADPTLADSRLPVLHWFIEKPSAANGDVPARCSLSFAGEFYDNAGATLHGQSSRDFTKKSYDFDLNPGHKFRWSPDAPGVDDFNLLSTWADKSHQRNVLAYDTYYAAGVPAHFAFAVRVQQNGAFFSVANFVENGDDNFLKRLGLDPQGALYKMYNSAEDATSAEKKTRKFEGAADLLALINGMRQSTAAARQTYLYDNLDVPEVINCLATRIITADVDCCHKNYYLYRDTLGTGEWQLMPWDVDLSFGRVWTCGSPCLAYYDETIYTNQSFLVGSGNIVLTPVFDTAATRQMFLRRLRTLMDALLQPPGTPLTNDFYSLRSLALRDLIAPDAALDLKKWGTWGRRETITQAVDRIWYEFLPGRRAYMFRTLAVTNRGGEIPLAQPADARLDLGPLEFRPASGVPAQEWLSVTNPNSYAVDISGWRLDGGVRFAFKAGTVIPAHTALYVSPDVRAFRARKVSPKGGERRLVVGPYSGNLSAWGESLVLLDPANRLVASNSFAGDPSLVQRYLRVTEIMYHPASLPGDAFGAEAYEYLELTNLGPVPLDLRGVALTKGVQFGFAAGSVTNLPPGARVLVVKNLTAFTARYGPDLPVAGEYVGNLDNQGEPLRLEDAFGEKVLEFAYDNRWQRLTDGPGFSLAAADETTPWWDWGNPAHWRVNGVAGGTPGTADPPLPAFTPIVISEFLAHTDPPWTDAIELHNPTGLDAAIGGWFLTDDLDQPRKFRLPPETVLHGHEYRYFTEADFNPVPGVPPSFGLGADGDQVWLFSGDGRTNLTGYLQGCEFGPTANGVSLGYHVNSTGETDYVPQAAVTLGRTNAGPLVGPVVISEIMYHPAGAGADASPASFIELANVGSTNAPLFHPSETTNTWRLRNAVDYDFPPATSLLPGARLVVVGFDPVADGPALARFREFYGLAPEFPVLGPWRGRLGNGDETLELKKPDWATTNGVPYVVVEKVHYLDHTPWPAEADGGGASLQRLRLLAYANEPTNWFASAPTPGAPNGPNVPPTVALRAPTAGAVFETPANIPLAAEATDPDGTVLRVEFFIDGLKLGAVAQPPFQFVWTNAPVGVHQVTARAVDDRLAVGPSSSATVTVLPPPPSVWITSPAAGAVLPAGAAIQINVQAQQAGGAIRQLELFANEAPLAVFIAPPYAFGWSNVTEGVYALTAVATAVDGRRATSTVVRVAFSHSLASAVTLIRQGARWSYLDDGSNQGTNWTRLEFADAGWASGPAELGYGDEFDNRPEATPIGYGPYPNQKHITTYFRHTFMVASAAEFAGLEARLLRDDGAVVYLNGAEAFRSNMPTNEFDFTTTASSAAAGADETNFFPYPVAPSFLREGANVLAVEVHQYSPTSTDVSFDFELVGTRVTLAPVVFAPPRSQQVQQGDEVRLEVQAGGSLPLAYEWRLNGTPLTGAAGAVLRLSHVALADAGSYSVVISNAAGMVVSPPAVLEVSDGPPGVNRLSLELLAGTCRLRFFGQAGSTWEIQRSPDLESWTRLVRAPIPAGRVLEYEDREPLPGAAFYRAVAIPAGD